MGYRVLGRTDELLKDYGPRPGLEGPFLFPNLRVVYYDVKEGAYWDPKTDFYLDQEEAAQLQNSFLNKLKG